MSNLSPTKLQEFIDSGGDITRPRVFLKEEIRRAATNAANLVSLFFRSETPPVTNWFRSSNSKFIRISNCLLTSVILTGKIAESNEWVHCVLSYHNVRPIQAAGTIIYLDDTELDEIDNSDEEISVQIGWLHHLDAYMFIAYVSEETYPSEPR